MNPFHRNGPPSIRFLTCEVEQMKQLVLDRLVQELIQGLEKEAQQQGATLNRQQLQRDVQPGQILYKHLVNASKIPLATLVRDYIN